MNDNPGEDDILAAELEAAKQTLTAASDEGVPAQLDTVEPAGVPIHVEPSAPPVLPCPRPVVNYHQAPSSSAFSIVQCVDGCVDCCRDCCCFIARVLGCCLDCAALTDEDNHTNNNEDCFWLRCVCCLCTFFCLNER
ncbi:uncharacterized protein LOC144645484 [Oculina patagonica]